MLLTPELKRVLAGVSLFAAIAGNSPSAAKAPGGGAEGPPVTLTSEGAIVAVSNGILRATIAPSMARVVSLVFRGHEMVQTLTRQRDIYFSMSGGKTYEQPGHCIYSITHQSPDGIDISCKRIYSPDRGNKHPWDLDIHFVLRRGASGLYSYAIVRHPADYRTVGMGEWRTVWRMPTQGDQYLMEKIYVDQKRHWKMPSLYDLAHAEPTPIKEIVRLTTGPWAGKYDCKYAYNAEYYNVGTYGHASDRNHVGAWIVLGGYDYFNDGPFKQDLAPASGIIHLHLYENHYGARGFKILHGQEWEKIYGPWLYYCNSGPTADDCWADAREQLAAERNAWPYTWLVNSDYPAESGRGAVTGRLVVHDPLKPRVSASNAWVGLALPEEEAGNWQYQGAAYQYWARAGANGEFTIPHVRPGSYTLYGVVHGAVGEFSYPGVQVSAGRSLSLGPLSWNVPHPGRRIAWEIGVPDRRGRELGSGKEFYLPYLYQRFPERYSNPLDYDTTRKKWTSAWNYAQNPYPARGGNVPWAWRIHFPLAEVPKGPATLTIAIAGSQAARLAVTVNAAAAPLTEFTPPGQGGNALLREGDHAKYDVLRIPIPASLLHAGANTITLAQISTRGIGNHVMYDYLSLELP